MGIAAAYLEMVQEIARHVAIPRVREVFVPPLQTDPDKSGEFGAVVLEDGSAGLMFVLLDDTLQRLHSAVDAAALQGADVVELARGFTGHDPVSKALALGAINAVGQFVLGRADYRFDYTTDSLGLFAPHSGDHVGMVGYFPPLVRQLRDRGISLTVIELDESLVQHHKDFRVTLDPAQLDQCNKILCTSTVVLNDSIDDILRHCSHAERVGIIGPTAGFLPDPLFARGVDTVGGNRVLDADEWLRRCRTQEKWGPSARKYCIQRAEYPGMQTLLRRHPTGRGGEHH